MFNRKRQSINYILKRCRVKPSNIIFIIFLITLFIFGVFEYSFKPKPAESASTDNVSGWAWSETIGWISFNNTPGGGSINYGVNIEPATGNFSGYAWSENIGWISFSPSGSYPAAPYYSARFSFATGKVTGWAKALAADGNGWDGWILLGKESGGWVNQVTIDTGTKEFRGWAWGDMVVGWISFNCADSRPGAPGGLCGTSNYKVKVDFNFPPTVTTSNIATCVLPGWNCCTDSRHPSFSWNYSDPVDGDLQASYRLQVDNNSDLSSPVLDTLIVDSGSWTYTWKVSDMVPPATDFVWGAKYYWRVKVKDARGAWSVPEWSNISSFTLPSHAYPSPDFNWLPQNPSALESVQFTDKTNFYNGKNSWFWTFENAVPANSILQNPVATFSSQGSWDVKLEVTDSAGFMCPKTQSVRVSYPWPNWKEIIPR